MKNVITGLVTIIIGGGLIIYRKPFVDFSTAFQNFAFRIPFGKRTIQFGYWFVLIIGLLLIIVGTLTLIGLVKVK